MMKSLAFIIALACVVAAGIGHVGQAKVPLAPPPVPVPHNHPKLARLLVELLQELKRFFSLLLAPFFKKF